MKTEVKKIDDTKREINVEVSGELVKNKFEDVFKKIGQEAKVPGFRPGHAPRDLLEKHYSSYAHEQVLKELVPDIYNQAVAKEGLDCLALPEISEVKLDRINLSFKARVEVSPEIAIKNYKGIKITYKKISVGPDEIKHSLDSVKESRKIDQLDDRFARGLGYPNMAELEKALERQIFLQKEREERQRIEKEVIDNLTAQASFKIPQSLVNRQLEDLLRQAKLDLALKGVEREELDKHEEELSKELSPQAKEQVKVYLILSEIAKRENIQQDEQMSRRVMEFLFREADWKEAA